MKVPPETDEKWIDCHCGYKIGGTYSIKEGYDFTCLHCWTKYTSKATTSESFTVDARRADET